MNPEMTMMAPQMAANHVAPRATSGLPVAESLNAGNVENQNPDAVTIPESFWIEAFQAMMLVRS
jgi:hypothetical protein